MRAATRPLGVSVMPLETRREAILHIATTADRLGYEAALPILFLRPNLTPQEIDFTLAAFR